MYMCQGWKILAYNFLDGHNNVKSFDITDKIQPISDPEDSIIWAPLCLAFSSCSKANSIGLVLIGEGRQWADMGWVLMFWCSILKNKRVRITFSLIGGSDYKLIYRHYATLYFVFCVDSSESELGILDLIQVFVETLDKCFESVCELDLIFHMDKVNHAI